MADHEGAAPKTTPRVNPLPVPEHGLPLLAAAMVHVFTATGILCALLATLAVNEGAYPLAFAWLGVALIVDGIDGTFARMVDVGRRLPRFSGERLDLVVDYVTYVFVPTLALLHAGKLKGTMGLALAGLILMSSLFHFSDNSSKTDDHCFVGFPAVWNIVAFHLFAFSPPAALTSGLILLCVGLTFIPMRWLHPMRVKQLLWLNLSATVVWLGAASHVLWNGFPATGWAAWALGITALYAVGLTLSWPLADPARRKD